MNTEEFAYISQLLKKRSGLALTEDKVYLLEARLMPIARACGCKDLPEFIAHLRLRADEKTIVDAVDAMSNNESMFFRDRKPFELLRSVVLPRALASGKRRIRIWSAACAAGQEPYSIAICLREEAAKLAGVHCELTASDISARMVERARRGIYTQFEVQRGLPITMLLKYFRQLPDTNWQVQDGLRSMVDFRTQNLLGDAEALGRFDVIFCRNVLLYFDDATKTRTLAKIARMLNPDGVLILGSAETVLGHSDRFKTADGEQGLHVVVE